MADVALVAGPSLPAPLPYVVPGAQEIVPKSATAQYDGSGAAGDYVPTLIIRAPNNSVLAHAPLGDTLAAGASADVSWFPRGRVAQSQAGSSVTMGASSGNYPPGGVDVNLPDTAFGIVVSAGAVGVPVNISSPISQLPVIYAPIPSGGWTIRVYSTVTGLELTALDKYAFTWIAQLT